LKKSDGTIISFEEVTKQREKDALSFSNYIGGSQSQFVRFIARLKVEKYEDVIKLLQDALYDVDFSVERAKTRIARVLNSIPHAKTLELSLVLFTTISTSTTKPTFMHPVFFAKNNF
jgi:hypothetical protein